ncbi:MAG: hypothetical protein H0V09_11225 [Gemmatimonadetes bacterium]|nr:hypothetical protein [Gemmatimonadota bacterium]
MRAGRVNPDRRTTGGWAGGLLVASLALSSLVLSPVGQRDILAQQQPSPGAQPPSRNHKVIQDPRLEADSTLFPYEWRALDQLERTVRAIRPSLEEADVRALVAAVPRMQQRVSALSIDSLPAALRSRKGEVTGRRVAMESALARVRRLSEAALRAPARPGSAVLLSFGDAHADSTELKAAVTGAEPLQPLASDSLPPLTTAGDDDEGASVGDGRSGAPDMPADSNAAATADSLANADLAAFLDAWRDAIGHAESLMHLIRSMPLHS